VIKNLHKELAAFQTTSIHLGKVLGYTLTAVYLYYAIAQMMNPWKIIHHRMFQEVVDNNVNSIVLGELAGALSLACSTTTLVQFVKQSLPITWKNLLTLSLTLCMFEVIFWSAAIWSLVNGDSHSIYSVWRAAWKPVVPFFWFVAMVMIIDSISKIEIKLGELKAAKYRLKKA